MEGISSKNRDKLSHTHSISALHVIVYLFTVSLEINLVNSRIAPNLIIFRKVINIYIFHPYIMLTEQT